VPPLAIIGIGCLFPRADGLGAYWANIKNRVDAIAPVPPTHWRPEDYYDPDPRAPDRVYTARGGFLDPVPFDPRAFGVAPNNLEATDTSQLLGLLVARQALEDAGYSAGGDAGPGGPYKPLDRSRVGVILGVTGTLELVIPLGARLGHPIWRRALREAGVDDSVAEDVVRRIGESYVGWQENSFPGLLGNVVAGRIANRFDLGGTNCVVDAACASSLSALHLAALELAAGRADVVLTGGVDTFNDIFMFTCFSKTPALSPTGDARPFDAAGDGTVLGEGLGVVVLKRLADAERDGDRVYAVVRGLGTSSDGRGNAIYAPKAAGQVEALRRAYEAAGVTPDTLELVEAHGTGTRVGDATEVEALTEVYRATGRSGRWCALGSVKSQVGHTKAAAGAAGLIKTAAALYHKVLPPTIKVREPLEALRSAESPFYVNVEKRPWLPSRGHPRRAGVSAFGFGGSNFHCVLEEAEPQKAVIDWDGDVQILALAADTPDALADRLAAWPADLSWQGLRDRAAAARTGWHAGSPCRLLLVVQRDRTDLPRLLASARSLLGERAGERAWRTPDGIFYGSGETDGKLAVLFPGQGAQYAGMLRDLACQFPQVLDTLAAADEQFAAEVGRGTRLADLIYPVATSTDDERKAADAALRATDVAQPALGAVGLGAWHVLQHFGVAADAAAGHSYGELVALCAAGRLGEADLHALSGLRGRLMASAGGGAGGMLAVSAAPEAVAAVLREESLTLTLANKNAPQQTVVSGPAADIERAAASFAARQIPARRLAVGGAFHSPLVADAQQPFRAALGDVEFRKGVVPVFANSTAAAYPEDADAARNLLGSQLARSVEFVAEVEALYRDGVRAFLEVGPGARLTGLVGLILQGRDHDALALDASSGKRSGTYDLACCLAWLASQGRPVRLAAWDGEARPAPAESRPPALTVSLCGANYVRPKPPRPPAAPPVATNGTLMANTNGATPARTPAAVPAPDAPAPPAATPPQAAVAGPSVNPPADASALAQALQLTRESLAAVQRMQEQTANLHRQFLDGQEAGQRTVQALVEQQQRLLSLSLGLPAAAPAPAVHAPPPAAPPAPAPLPPAPAVAPAPPPARPAAPTAPVAAPARAVTAAPAPAATPAPPAAAALPDRSAGDNLDVTRVLLEVVSEKTGYPSASLEPDMALDADLGIDSIKRVEILSALQERLPDAPAVGPEHLGSLLTLRHIADFLAAGGPAPAAPARAPEAPPPPAPAAEPTPAPRTGTELERSVLRAAPLDGWAPRPAVAIPAGSEIWVTNEDAELAGHLAGRLRERGYRPRLLPLAAVREQERPATLGGLVVLAPAGPPGEALLKDALRGLQRVAPALRRCGREGGAVFAAVSRLDSAFGLRGLDPAREPLDGGLAGLAKTARLEWPEVACKALDLPGAPPDVPAAAAALADELLLAGPVEVGLADGGRVTLERVAEPLPAGAGDAPLAAGDVVVVSGGARGVTAEVAVALARAFRPTLVLLGRSPAPEPEPNWLAALGSEAEIKRELSLRANGSAAPKLIGERCRQVLANREVRRTLARVEEAGARAVYRSADVRDAGAVAQAVAAVRAEMGPVRGLIHGAGVLADALIEDKTDEQFDRVFSTKVGGLRALLGAVPPDELRVLVLFSSSTGRFGRAGQVDYAVANEVLNKLARQQARRRPACRVLSVNWGPWDGGMVNASLKRLFEKEGVGLIAPEAGADYLVRELQGPAGGPVEVVVLAGGMPEAAVTPAAAPAAGPGLPPPLPVAFERPLEPADHPVLESHVLDGRPVLPMALMLEWLAHAALHQNPGLAFHGVNDLRVLHGVVLGGGAAPALRVGAGKAVRQGETYVAPVEIRSARPDGRDVLHARAEVVLADTLPEAPAAHAAPAGRPYPHGPDAIYRDLLFHGPDLHAIERVAGCGEEGLSAAVRAAPPPAAWLRQPLRQRWITDPLALDGSFQLMTLWTRELRGAPSLPCFARRYRQYRRGFPPGGVRVVARVSRATDRLALADLDYVDADGRLVARLEGYECAADPALQRAFRRNRAAEPALR
jgi:acyl transferase domain-containing protein